MPRRRVLTAYPRLAYSAVLAHKAEMCLRSTSILLCLAVATPHAIGQAIDLVCQDTVYEEVIYSGASAERLPQQPESHRVKFSQSNATIQTVSSDAPPYYELDCEPSFDNGVSCISLSYGRFLRISSTKNFTYVLAQPAKFTTATGYYEIHTGTCEQR